MALSNGKWHCYGSRQAMMRRLLQQLAVEKGWHLVAGVRRVARVQQLAHMRLAFGGVGRQGRLTTLGEWLQ